MSCAILSSILHAFALICFGARSARSGVDYHVFFGFAKTVSTSRTSAAYSGKGGQPDHSLRVTLPMYCKSAIPILLV